LEVTLSQKCKFFIKNLKNVLHIFSFLFCLFLLVSANFSFAQQPGKDSSATSLPSDTLKPKSDTILVNKDKGDIETTIKYSARDSIRMDVVKKIVYLYGDANILYGDISLKAGLISIDWQNSIMAAKPLVDSSGKRLGVPVFVEKADTYEADSIKYNFKTKKGFISGIVTKQGEGYITGGPVKKDEDVLFVNSAQYTTCNLRHPHFYIHARKLKVIPDDKVVSGPFNLVVGDVPTPLGFFLGFFPMPRKEKSGIIFPTFGATAQRGFFLSQGGYYWAVNDYVGIKLVGDGYGNGSWRASSIVDYKNRYAYTGKLTLNMSEIKNSFNPSDTKNQDFQIQWTHNSVPKHNSSFMASVNIYSQKYLTNNSFNPTNLQTNASASSVQYTKSFGTLFNLTVAVRQDQNIRVNQMVMNFTLPEVNFSMNRIYPFKQKLGTGQKWYEKINMAYNFTTKYTATNLPFLYGFVPANFDDSRDTINLSGNNAEGVHDPNFNFLNALGKTIGHGMKGAKHTIPISTTMKVLKYFNLNPSFTYNEYWYDRKLHYTFDTTHNRLVVSDSFGFNRTSDYNLSTSLTTRIYGRYNFTGQIIRGIMHTIVPTITYSFHPDFSQNQPLSGDNIKRVQTSNFYSDPKYWAAYSNYNGFFYGAPTAGKVNSLGFSIQNTMEAKVRSRKDTVNPIKKIKLIDNLSASGGYNFAADSLNLSMINLSLRTTLFTKLNINISSTYDPYLYRLDSIGKTSIYRGNNYQTRVNQYVFGKNNKSPESANYKGSQNFQVNLSFSLNPKSKTNNTPPGLSAQQTNFMNANPNMYLDFKIPWNLSLNYVYSYIRTGFNKSINSQSLSFSGDVKLSEKWKVAFTSGYDFVLKGLSYTTFSINRDLHCWQMSFNVVPFGLRQSYFFTLSAKSSILQDLKLNKRSPAFIGQPF
jgi:LptD protein